MGFHLVRIRRFFPKALLSVALIPLLPWSCQRRAPPPPPTPPPVTPPAVVAPAPPSSLELGDQYFDAADYPNAAASYTEYLRGSLSAPDRDRVLFRLALIHAFPANPAQDSQQAMSFLRDLLNQYPQSPFRPQAHILLEFQQEIERLRSEISLREERIGELTQQVARLEQVELEKLRADVNRREERIQQLTQELERLKQIDMERRPTPPPR